MVAALLDGMLKNLFELKQDGTVERVGGFGAYGPTVEASTKTEAATKFMAFAYRTLENPPTVKISNGAWQMVSEALVGISVEAGIEGRKLALCIAGGQMDRKSVTDETASFAYYASEAYRSAVV